MRYGRALAVAAVSHACARLASRFCASCFSVPRGGEIATSGASSMSRAQSGASSRVNVSNRATSSTGASTRRSALMCLPHFVPAGSASTKRSRARVAAT